MSRYRSSDQPPRSEYQAKAEDKENKLPDGDAIASAPGTTRRVAKAKSTAKKPQANGEPSSAKAKAPAKGAAKEPVKANGTKRKAEDEEPSSEEEKDEARAAKKQRTTAVPKKRSIAEPQRKLRKPINEVPSHKLDVFVFGEGSSGELGLGSKRNEGKKPIDVKRPRINHLLDAKTVGVVQIASGGMHAVALTHDNRILTWGVNDDKALGRDTTWDGGLRDMDDESDDDDDSGVNPHESTPGDVDTSAFTPGTKIVQVAACDSATFALSEDGSVYGWGTFRGTDGIIGFSESVRVQPTPVLLSELKNITMLACGANHVLALDKDGKVFTWGSGGQYQLGRKPLTRHDGVQAGLRPEACGRFTKRQHAVHIAAGSYHSFFLDNKGSVWGWGLNNYSQTGHSEQGGEDDAMILVPKVVPAFEGKKVLQLSGGMHHSIACTEDGALLTWGRVDGHQVGHDSGLFNEANTISDENGKPRILVEPTVVPGMSFSYLTAVWGLSLTNIDINASFVVAGGDNNFVIDKDGKVYSWGFSANYQTGQGTTEDVEVPTLIDNTAIRGKKIIWAGAGGQYSIITAVHSNDLPNGN
jgi:regulator of chromosome condensation